MESAMKEATKYVQRFLKGHPQVVERNSETITSAGSFASEADNTKWFYEVHGKTCCPLIIYPFKRIPERTSESVRVGWGIACSAKRWMRAEVSFKYIANIFHPFFVTECVKIPVVPSFDSYKLHLTFHVSVLCSVLEIEIVTFYPNMTRILQTVDVLPLAQSKYLVGNCEERLHKASRRNSEYK
ncbi:hypothetical protein Cfor_09804 [Coptotermes formosanus]|uniref:Uncharacterized protein n=1 Tax=Coptotermes formosanus TaxID=36987 RepID=A0A6L2Q676_COPFO|nr:hypothetical protein Cfor_09804 [Coptotermes formosanus]